MIYYKSLIVISAVSLLFFSCEGNKKNEIKESNNPFTKNLINPFFFDQIFNTPNNCGSFWNAKYINQIDVNKVSIFLKGGNNPDNILEKYIYTFDKNGNNDNYSYYYYPNSKDVVNQSNFEYNGNELSKINIYKYFGIGNLPPVFVSKDPNRTVFYKSKANGKNDSLFYFPSVENPTIIIDKIGNFVNYIEIFVKEGSSRNKIIHEISKVDSNLTNFDFADKSITYTRNGLPIESYHLGENWIQLERSQTWEYNDFNQPVIIKEWMHGTLIKDIHITYNENSLPKKIEYNRKKYHLIYGKI
ncbi:MAG: hypothetical protein V4622_01850 [Bacteroidota bacterium]